MECYQSMKPLNNISNNVYIGTEDVYITKGLIFRIILNLIPFGIFVSFKDKFSNSKFLEVLNWYSFFIILLVFLYLIKINPTIIDRFVVFLLPYQILVYTHFVEKLNLKEIKNFFILSISFFYLLFSINWLFMSENNFRVYIPYKSVIWENYNKSKSVICNPLNKCQLEGGGNFVKYE